MSATLQGMKLSLQQFRLNRYKNIFKTVPVTDMSDSDPL